MVSWQRKSEIWNSKFRRNINGVISAQPLRKDNYSEAQWRKKIREHFYVWLYMKTKYERIKNKLFQMGRRYNLKSKYNFQILRIFHLSSMDWNIIWSYTFLRLRIVAVGPVDVTQFFSQKENKSKDSFKKSSYLTKFKLKIYYLICLEISKSASWWWVVYLGHRWGQLKWKQKTN